MYGVSVITLLSEPWLVNAIAAYFGEAEVITTVSYDYVVVVAHFVEARLYVPVAARCSLAEVRAVVFVHVVCVIALFSEVWLGETVSTDFIETEMVAAISKYEVAIVAYLHSIKEPAIAADVQSAVNKAEIIIGNVAVITPFSLEVRIESFVVKSVSAVCPFAVITRNALVIVLGIAVITLLSVRLEVSVAAACLSAECRAFV